MNPNPKSTREEAEKTQAEPFAFAPALAQTVQNGLKRTAEIQKSALELSAKQTAEIADVCKKTFLVPPPAAAMFDYATQAFQSFVDVQKTIIDLACDQATSVVAHTQLRADAYTNLAGAFNALVGESIDRAVTAQKTVLEFAAQQNTAVGEAYRTQPGVTGTPAAAAAETVQRNIETAIETQKEVLTATAKAFKAAATKA